MTTTELDERFRDRPELGPFAGLKTGSRAERPDFSEWGAYDRLAPTGRHTVQEVWSGARAEADLIDGTTIYRLRHAGCGLPDPNGHVYGFAVKALDLAPAVAPKSSDAASRVGRGWVACGALLLVLAAFAGGWCLAHYAPHLTPGGVTQQTNAPRARANEQKAMTPNPEKGNPSAGAAQPAKSAPPVPQPPANEKSYAAVAAEVQQLRSEVTGLRAELRAQKAKGEADAELVKGLIELVRKHLHKTADPIVFK